MDESAWESTLSKEAQYIWELIKKNHNYFQHKDKLYKWIVRILKILILFLAMANTVVLGLKDVIAIDYQIVAGLAVSSLLTFITAISSYFNFEEYWMRNIKIHIQLNIIRDNFRFDAISGKMDSPRVEKYRKDLETIQNENIKYWSRAINKI